MTQRSRVLVVFGSGPGIGTTTASLFASKIFDKIALIARNQARLNKDKAAVEQAAIAANREVEVKTWSLDLAKVDTLKAALPEIEKFGKPELVFYNAARVRPDKLLQEPLSEIRYDFEITTLALYVVAQWAIPLLTDLTLQDPEANPSLFVTGGLLHIYPLTDYFTLSLTKTAQRNLVQTLAMEFQHAGIHIGMITVGGVVAPEKKYLNPTYISERIWEHYAQRKEDWKLEVEILED